MRYILSILCIDVRIMYKMRQFRWSSIQNRATITGEETIEWLFLLSSENHSHIEISSLFQAQPPRQCRIQLFEFLECDIFQMHSNVIRQWWHRIMWFTCNQFSIQIAENYLLDLWNNKWNSANPWRSYCTTSYSSLLCKSISSKRIIIVIQFE